MLAHKVWPKIKCWRGLRSGLYAGQSSYSTYKLGKQSLYGAGFLHGGHCHVKTEQEQTVDTKVSKLSCCNTTCCHLNQMAQTRKEPQMKVHGVFRYFWPYIACMFASTFLQVMGASSLQLINPTYQTAKRLL